MYSDEAQHFVGSHLCTHCLQKAINGLQYSSLAAHVYELNQYQHDYYRMNIMRAIAEVV